MLRVGVARVDDVAGAAPDATPAAWFGASERARWASLAPGARGAFVAGRALARRLLEDATSVPAACWQLSADVGTSPVARLRADVRSHAAAATPRVSLSHRLGWVAATVVDGADEAVGVDIECWRPARSPARERAALMLSAAELDAWLALPADERDAALLRAWTAKEAWFKAAPTDAAPWDFRRIDARACDPARANVRSWAAAGVTLAVCCSDPRALAEVVVSGLAPTEADAAPFLHVQRVGARDTVVASSLFMSSP